MAQGRAECSPEPDFAPAFKLRDRVIHLDWITDQWDRMGRFYASLERQIQLDLNGWLATRAKHFYRANRELGRVFKTEHILQIMSDPLARQRIRRGILKNEELHALARQVSYGNHHCTFLREYARYPCLEEKKGLDKLNF